MPPRPDYYKTLGVERLAFRRKRLDPSTRERGDHVRVHEPDSRHERLVGAVPDAIRRLQRTVEVVDRRQQL